jgi:hypothetical protein
MKPTLPDHCLIPQSPFLYGKGAYFAFGPDCGNLSKYGLYLHKL